MDMVPELGTWELIFEGTDNRKIGVTFLRHIGNEAVGVIEFWPEGPSKTLSLFIARVDPARQTIRFGEAKTHAVCLNWVDVYAEACCSLQKARAFTSRSSFSYRPWREIFGRPTLQRLP
jgi:hypothetical protein